MMKALYLLASLACASDSPFPAWERFEKEVRDQTLPKDSLKAIFAEISTTAGFPLSALSGGNTHPVDSPWVFPVAGYGIASVGKGGFQPGIYYGGSALKGYDFFDGNRHGGHPAYDIFIRDLNHDSRDDRNGKPVPVLAPTRLMVLSRQVTWDPGSPLRGGKYLWAAAPGSDLLFYFAHLDSVIASPGDTLTAGQALGTVGRTGKNAHARRSPTHLHFMVLRVENLVPVPFDYLRFLPR